MPGLVNSMQIYLFSLPCSLGIASLQSLFAQAVGFQHCFYDRVHRFWHGSNRLLCMAHPVKSGALQAPLAASMLVCEILLQALSMSSAAAIYKSLRIILYANWLHRAICSKRNWLDSQCNFTFCPQVICWVANIQLLWYKLRVCALQMHYQMVPNHVVTLISRQAGCTWSPGFQWNHLRAHIGCLLLGKGAQMNIWPVHQLTAFTRVQLWPHIWGLLLDPARRKTCIRS